MKLTKTPHARREVQRILETQMLERHPDIEENSCGMKRLAAYYRQKYELPKAQVNAMFLPLQEIEQQVRKGLKLSEKTMATYFDPPRNGEWCLGSIIEYANGQQMSTEEACAFTLLVISDECDDTIGSLSMVSFLQALQKLDLSNDFRWQLAELCSNWNHHQAVVEEILARGSRLFEKALPIAQPLIDSWYEEMERKLAAGTLCIDHLRLANIQDYTVCPALAYCNAVGVRNFALEAGNLPSYAPTISYGVLYDNLSTLVDARQQDDAQLVQSLKTLGDKQRMRIFRALQKAPRFGSELAQLTGLSPATISHHMTELIHADLVTLEISGQRSVYHINPEGVRKLAAAIEALI